jgi:hypothetical protein
MTKQTSRDNQSNSVLTRIPNAESLRATANHVLISASGLVAIALTALTAFTTSCSNGTGASSPQQQPLAPSRNTLLRTQDLKLPKLVCENSSECPAAVGELITYTSAGIRYCTASLVAPDLILTASHCVPWENTTNQGLFTGGCWIRWPALERGASEELTTCTSIVDASILQANKEGIVQPDYAFLKIAKPSERPPLIILTNAPPRKTGQTRRRTDETRIELYGVAPQQSPHLIQRHRCRRNDSFPLFAKKDMLRQAIIMPGCPAEQGHSGGPLLDSPIGPGEVPFILGVMSLIEFRDASSNTKISSVAVGTRVALPQLESHPTRTRSRSSGDDQVPREVPH